jgi:hypothetical protein
LPFSLRVVPVSIALILFAGCSTVPKAPSVEPAPSPDLDRARAEAQVCTNPAVAREEVSKSFKYGCFCGAGYPGLKHPSGKAEQEFSPAERSELIASYLRIKPIDDIDAACQAHDICWVLNGRPELACNIAFKNRLDALRKAWNGHLGWIGSERQEYRCARLALDISFATATVMEGVSNDAAEQTASDVTKAASLPLTAGYALVAQFGGTPSPHYPLAGERCVVNR